MKNILIRCDNSDPHDAGLHGQHFDKEVNVSRFPPNENLHLKLTNVTHVILKNLDARALDLLELASFIYYADNEIRRGSETDILAKSWKRNLTFVVPCRNPDLWNSDSVNDHLRRMLGFLSGDEYRFHFVKAKPHPQQAFLEFQTHSLPPLKDADCVGLFSGGLDSLAGIVAEVKSGRKPILISHRSQPKISSLQKRLVELLQERIKEWCFPHISLWVNRRGKPRAEYTQRTRSFLYLSLASSVAYQCGIDNVRVFENGVVSFNIPLLGQNVGTFLTRATHPKFVSEFSEFISLILGRQITFTNPFQLMTKGEVAKVLRDNGYPELIEATVSCAHTWMTTKLQQHCGTCSRCIDRRFAIESQSLQNYDPTHGYKKDLFIEALENGAERACAIGYINTAVKIAKMNSEEFFAEFPELYDALGYVGESSAQAAQDIYDLFKEMLNRFYL